MLLIICNVRVDRNIRYKYGSLYNPLRIRLFMRHKVPFAQNERGGEVDTEKAAWQILSTIIMAHKRFHNWTQQASLFCLEELRINAAGRAEL